MQQQTLVLKNFKTIKKFEYYVFKDEDYVSKAKPGSILFVNPEPEKIEKKTNLLNNLLIFLAPILYKIEDDSKENSYANMDELIEESRNFIDSLSEYEREILRSYTKIGDRVINNILRGERSAELGQFVMDNIKKFQDYYDISILPKELVQKLGWVPVYIQEFLRVCNKVPKLKYNISLYRGIQVKDFKFFRPIENEFVSTTIDLDVARNFKKRGECCLLNLLVQKGTKALFLAEISQFGEEQEVLLIQPLSFKTLLSDSDQVNMLVSSKKIKDDINYIELAENIIQAKENLDVIDSFKSLKKLPSIMFASTNKENNTVFILSFYYEKNKYFVHIAQDLPVIREPNKNNMELCSNFFYKVIEILSDNGIETIHLHSRTESYLFFRKYLNIDEETDEITFIAGGAQITCIVY